jgi:hypothetical protein
VLKIKKENKSEQMKYGIKGIFKFILIFILGAIIVFLCISYLSKTQTILPENKKTENTGYRYAKPIQSITGFEYTEHLGSKRLISIKSRHFAIHRKKTGFVRFALMKEAVLWDCVIKFYLYPEEKPGEKKKNSQETFVPGPEDIKNSLGILTAKDSKLLSRLNNVSSILIHPVTIEFYLKDKLVSSISAMSGAINLSNRKILFTGKVVVISGPRKMMIDRLELNPDTRLLIGTNYVLHSPEGEKAGKHITTDFSLTKVYE